MAGTPELIDRRLFFFLVFKTPILNSASGNARFQILPEHSAQVIKGK